MSREGGQGATADWKEQDRDWLKMCGRVIQAKGPIEYAIVDGLDLRDSRLSNYPRRWNGAPSQEFLVIRQNSQSGERSLDLLKWGLIPYGPRRAGESRSTPRRRRSQHCRLSATHTPAVAAFFR